MNQATFEEFQTNMASHIDIADLSQITVNHIVARLGRTSVSVFLPNPGTGDWATAAFANIEYLSEEGKKDFEFELNEFISDIGEAQATRKKTLEGSTVDLSEIWGKNTNWLANKQIAIATGFYNKKATCIICLLIPSECRFSNGTKKALAEIANTYAASWAKSLRIMNRIGNAFGDADAAGA